MFARGLENSVRLLTAAGKQVWIVGPVPEVGTKVPRFLFLQSLGFAKADPINPTVREYDARQRNVFQVFNELKKKYPVKLVMPQTMLCGAQLCDIEKDGRPLYFGGDHLSVYGAKIIAPIFAPIFEK